MSTFNFSDVTYVSRDDEVVVLPEDALVSSCCSWRLAQQGKTINFRNTEILKFLEDQDREMANALRQHFSKKLMWAQLSGKPLSKFRSELQAFLHSDPKKITEGLSGLIYRLPDFYIEDTTFNSIVKSVNIEVFDTRYKTGQYTVELVPIGTTKRLSRSENANYYWLRGSTDNRLYLIKVRQPNPIEHIFVDIFNSSAILNVTGNFAQANREFAHFYNVLNWKLEK